MLIFVIRRWYICHWYRKGIGKCVQWHDVSFQLETSETLFVGSCQAVFKWLNLFAATVFLIIDKSSVLRGKSRCAPYPLWYKLVLPTKKLPGRILKLLNYCLAIFHSRWHCVFSAVVSLISTFRQRQFYFNLNWNSCRKLTLFVKVKLSWKIRSSGNQLEAFHVADWAFFIRFLCIIQATHGFWWKSVHERCAEEFFLFIENIFSFWRLDLHNNAIKVAREINYSVAANGNILNNSLTSSVDA